MKDINLVLCYPEIPQNTGNIARTSAATGASLHLIRPLGFTIDDKKMKRAGLDYWDKLDVRIYDSLEDFYAQNEDAAVYYFSTKAPRAYTDVTYPRRVFLMFGAESKGLPEPLLKEHPDTTVRVPMLPHLRSLNLSNTVAIATYEVLRQRGFEGLEAEGTPVSFVWGEHQK